MAANSEKTNQVPGGEDARPDYKQQHLQTRKTQGNERDATIIVRLIIISRAMLCTKNLFNNLAMLCGDNVSTI